jgi:hypothetical protein
MSSLCQDKRMWHAAYRGLYPLWSQNVSYNTMMNRDWQSLVKEEYLLRKYWRKQYETVLRNEERLEIEPRRYLCRILEPSPNHVRHYSPMLSRFLVVDYTTSNRGIMSTSAFSNHYPASEVVVWSFPEHRIVYRKMLRPEGPEPEEMLEVGWLGQVIVSALWSSDHWDQIRIYDISSHDEMRLVSSFKLHVKILASQVYMLPNWLQRQDCVEMPPEVVIAGIERSDRQRGLLIRHDISTGQTRQLILMPDTRAIFFDSRFPDILITTDSTSVIQVWCAYTGRLLVSENVPKNESVMRFTLASVVESTSMHSTLSGSARTLRVITYNEESGGNASAIYVWALDIARSPARAKQEARQLDIERNVSNDPLINIEVDATFQKPPTQNGMYRKMVQHINVDNTMSSFRTNGSGQLNSDAVLRLISKHPVKRGEYLGFRAIGSLLFVARENFEEIGMDNMHAAVIDLDSGEEIYQSRSLGALGNMMPLGRELLFHTNDAMFTIGYDGPVDQEDVVTYGREQEIPIQHPISSTFDIQHPGPFTFDTATFVPTFIDEDATDNHHDDDDLGSDVGWP